MIAYVIKDSKEGYADVLYGYTPHVNEATLFAEKSDAENAIEEAVKNSSTEEGVEYIIKVEIRILKGYPPKKKKELK